MRTRFLSSQRLRGHRVYVVGVYSAITPTMCLRSQRLRQQIHTPPGPVEAEDVLLLNCDEAFVAIDEGKIKWLLVLLFSVMGRMS